ncbi:MAG TPA: oxygen-independent coproporphyrinogen III oxidase, partial [Caulobacteraceae bacterium]|nr:oxygen-independent coproporphyrinogen III oxidase [Caulobacteraceae bacterium]
APRYTSYPTAAQFTPQVDSETYAAWLGALPADAGGSIYVHVPFCDRLCWYCGCNTRVVRRGESISGYVALVEAEMRMVAGHLAGVFTAREIHLGGGTPNILSPTDLGALFGALRSAFRVDEGAEVSAEIDPSRLTPEWVRAAAANGLTRASLGVQDLSPSVQAAVNRLEPFEVVATAATRLREAGVRSLNLDLMYGLPHQRTADVLSTLDTVLTLAPDRLALFGYAHVPWMKAHQKLIDERTLPGEAERLDESEAAAERLQAAGYVRIGLDHYALPTDELAKASARGELRRNFQGYTTDQEEILLGLGVSAIGRLPQGLAQNHSVELAWRAAVREGRLPTARGVAFTDDDQFRGDIIEALMCRFEVDLADVRRKWRRSRESLAGAQTALAELERDGVIERQDERIAVTPVGRPFVRQVCAAFDSYLAPGALRHSSAV